ncbi:ATP-binding protein [Streptomyces sp. NPDC001380]|uniref:ATP-binding protein n=1 Tax=Streptomyces sp. NPDC001380 TaxID=3364566 RepID=UPI0036837045
MAQTLPHDGAAPGAAPGRASGGPAALRREATFDGAPGTALAARAFAADFLARAAAATGRTFADRTRDALQLVVGELVANVVRYAPGPCLLDLELTGGALEVTVWDTEVSLPVPRVSDAARVGGHGLEIVAALCRSVEADLAAGGKRVRVRLPLV